MTFIKYPKIKHLGDKETLGLFSPGPVVVQEKIDGANFAFFIENDTINFSKRSSNLTDGETLQKNKDKSTKWLAITSIMEVYQKNPEKFKKNLYYFGESMQKHTLAYDDIPGFVGFDVYDLETHEVLDWKIAKKAFESLGLPFIHVHFEKDGSEITVGELKELIKTSTYRKGEAEGVIIKRYDKKNVYGRQLYGKILAEQFHEIKSRPDSEKVLAADEIKIANEYATSARIEKIIHKLHDDGHEIEMPMMKILFKEVTKDILEEEILDIYGKYHLIDFKILDKMVSKKCVKTLKRVMEKKIS